jgi:hypothetical protein
MPQMAGTAVRGLWHTTPGRRGLWHTCPVRTWRREYVRCVTGSAADRAAVLVPGQRYGTDGPLLMYPGLAVERRGGYTHRLSWAVPEFADDDDERAWVTGQVAAAIDATVTATGVAAPVVIGKSLASLSAPVVADRRLTAIWLTPILTDERTVSALRAAEGPCLLVGGTADRVWDGRTARLITPHVLEVEGADHGMLVPRGLSASAAVLGQVVTAVEAFLDRVAWPP